MSGLVIVAVYVGGALANLPLGLSARGPSSLTNALFFTLGWPVVLLGVCTGAIRVQTEVRETDE